MESGWNHDKENTLKKITYVKEPGQLKNVLD